MNHYPHHLGDYIKATVGLSQGEHGAYRLLMDAAYSCERGIDPDEVYSITKAFTPAERKNTERVVKKYWIPGADGLLHQRRIDEEVAEYQRKATHNRTVGAKGGRPRNNPEGNPDRNPEETRTVTRSEPRAEPGRNPDRIPDPNPEITLASNQEPINPRSKSAFPDANHTGDPPEPVTALRLLCERSRVTVNVKARMHLAQWHQEGVTEIVIAQAIAIARERKPDPELIPLAYLVPIVQDLKNGRVGSSGEPTGKDAIPAALERIAEREKREAERPKNGRTHPLAEPEWWETPAGIQREGRQRGVQPRPEDEGFPDYAARVFVVAGNGPWMQHLTPQIRDRVEHWRVVGVNP